MKRGIASHVIRSRLFDDWFQPVILFEADDRVDNREFAEKFPASQDVTDAGVEYLKGLTALKVLYLYGNHFTDAGVARLQKALPNCAITH